MADKEKARSGPDWLLLFRCFRIANDPVKVWFGFLGVAVTALMLCAAVLGLLELRGATGDLASGGVVESLCKGDTAVALHGIQAGIERTCVGLRRDVESIAGARGTTQFTEAIGHAVTLRETLPWAMALALLLWLPWAFFAGAISRSAAVELAAGERLSAAEVREFASGRYSSYLWSPLTLGLVIGLILLCMMLIGLACAHLLAAAVLVCGFFGSLYLGVVVKQKKLSTAAGLAVSLPGFAVTAAATVLCWNVPLVWLGRVVLVLALPFVVVLGLAAVLAALVLVFGRGIMMAAISFEGTETFDAIARAGDYVLKRPWRLLFYWAVGIAYGVPCVAAVGVLAGAALAVALAAVSVGFGQSFCDVFAFASCSGGGFLAWLSGFLLGAVITVLSGLVLGWCVSFVYSYHAICYALVRKSVDLSEVSEVYQEPGRTPPSAPPGH